MTKACSIFAAAPWIVAGLLGPFDTAVSAQPPRGAGTPRIDVSAPTQDLGLVPRGQAAEARFTIGNSGDAVLNILQAKPG